MSKPTAKTGSTYGDYVQRIEQQIADEMIGAVADAGGLDEDVSRKIAEFGGGDGVPSAAVVREVAKIGRAKRLRETVRKIVEKAMETAKRGRFDSATISPVRDLGVERVEYRQDWWRVEVERLLVEKGYGVVFRLYLNATTTLEQCRANMVITWADKNDGSVRESE